MLPPAPLHRSHAVGATGATVCVDAGQRTWDDRRHMRGHLGALGLMAMVSVAVACGSSSDGEPSTQDAASSKESGAALALEGSGTSRCDREGVELRMEQFADALANADVRTLRRLWGEGFKWFSVTIARKGGDRRQHFVAYSPARAMRYVQRKSGLPLRFDEVSRERKVGPGGADFGLQGPGGAAGPTHRDLSPARTGSTVTPRRSRSQASACHRPIVLRRREFEPVRAPDRARAWRGTSITLAGGSRPGREPYRRPTPPTSSSAR